MKRSWVMAHAAQYRMPPEDVTALRGHVFELCKAALPDPADRTLFIQLMGEASANGLGWIESLEYVAVHRTTAPLRH